MIVVTPLLPCVTVNDVGEADSLKLPKPFTVNVTVMLVLRLPEAPVIVIDAFPFLALDLAVNVRVLVLVAGFGLKAAVTPLGNPVAENETFPLKPFAGVMVIVLAA